MIKFFRKIRQKVLTENKFSKYLLYAIGEILLVMVGILLALQVNNWNEKRKLLLDERLILNGVLEDIKRDTIDLNFNMRGYQQQIELDSIILDHLINKKENSELFEKSFRLVITGDFILTLHTSSYDEAKLKGITTETNNPLWDRINRLYNFYYPELIRFEHDFYTYKIDEYLFSVFDDVLEIDSLDGHPTINDKNYNELLANKNIHWKFRRTKFLHKGSLSRYNTVYSELLEIIDLIKIELNKE
ncbi:DUF6090 family protein [Flavobacteriaceae sp. LMIT009]